MQIYIYIYTYGDYREWQIANIVESRWPQQACQNFYGEYILRFVTQGISL